MARLFVWCGSSLRFLGREICELKHSSISCYRRQFLKLRGYPYWNPVLETVDKSFSSTLGKFEGLRISLIHSASSIPRLAESHRVQCKDRFWTRPLSSASKTYEENLPPLSGFPSRSLVPNWILKSCTSQILPLQIPSRINHSRSTRTVHSRLVSAYPYY